MTCATRVILGYVFILMAPLGVCHILRDAISKMLKQSVPVKAGSGPGCCHDLGPAFLFESWYRKPCQHIK